ncbi:MAG: hypothetical protein MK132_13085 [Lentisphaerales bacterium]|nr:hypothetical protein [Lentisphaerales bacterium]
MECKYLDFKSIKQVLLIVLISLPLAGCSVFEDDEYIDDKPWSRPASWENQGLNIPY